MKGFKYQITLKVLLKNHKENGDTEFAPVNFNPANKTVINSECMLDKSFKEMWYRIDNWINEGSGWIIESIKAEYANISVCSPLSGSTYIELPVELRNSTKTLINIKNNNNKCFRWCHNRHLNPLKTHPERIKKADKKVITDLDYIGFDFPVSKTILARLNEKIIFALMYFIMKMIWLILLCIKWKFESYMNLLLITNENKSHYAHFKDFNIFMCNRIKNKNKKHFFKCYLQCFSSGKILIKHKEKLLDNKW